MTWRFPPFSCSRSQPRSSLPEVGPDAASPPPRSPARSCTPARSAAPDRGGRPASPCRSGRGAPRLGRRQHQRRALRHDVLRAPHEAAGFTGSTWWTTSQSQSAQIAARCCFHLRHHPGRGFCRMASGASAHRPHNVAPHRTAGDPHCAHRSRFVSGAGRGQTTSPSAPRGGFSRPRRGLSAAKSTTDS